MQRNLGKWSAQPPGRRSRPTRFVMASEGATPDYIVDLYQRLPAIPKRLIQLDGSVYWMLSTSGRQQPS
jgi:hypothetical protein